MPNGHTKFYCDLAFGMLKKKFKNSFISNLNELKQCVLDSTPLSKLNQCQLVGNEKGNDINVIQYSWSDWFEENGFKSLPGKTKYHYFKFTRPCYVSVKESYLDEYTEVKIIEGFDTNLDLPPMLEVPKLPFDRQKYLFEKIRSFCREDSKDILCSDPTTDIFKPGSIVTLKTTVRSAERTRAIKCCSKCRKQGHNKNNCLTEE